MALLGFIGLINYYRCFVQNNSIILQLKEFLKTKEKYIILR